MSWYLFATRVSSGVYGSSVQPIPPFQISPLRPVESVNVCSRKRGAGKKVAKKLIIDKDTRITSSQMRWNMLHSEQTIGRRNDILAESRSRSQVQYLLSKLSEFWVRQRRVCEVALKQKISNGEIKDDLEEDELFRIPSMNESSSSMGTSTVREDNDASIEIHRFARDTSLVAPDSLLRGLIDISINQTSSIGESFAQMRDSLQKTREQFAANIAANLQNNAACESTPLNLPVHHTGTSQSQSTTLVPVLEEFEEQVQQPKEIGQLPAAPELTEAPPKAGPSHVPPSPPKLIKPLSGKSRLWRYIQGQLVDLSRDSIYFEELCPAGSTKKEAAFAFMSLLEFAKKRWVVLSQTEEFGQITIRLPSQ
ncbi:unnamed protein product [Heterobilharzia americana]|nr:unnamed protein product [Heterobilharzia americana]